MTLATKAELVAQVKQLQRSLDRANRSLDDAKKKVTTLGRSVVQGHEREKATAEILAVISRSPTDAQPVFDGIANAALHLIGGSSISPRSKPGAWSSTSRASTCCWRSIMRLPW